MKSVLINEKHIIAKLIVMDAEFRTTKTNNYLSSLLIFVSLYTLKLNIIQYYY